MQGSIDDLKLQLMAHREIIVTVMDGRLAESAMNLAKGLPQVAAAEVIAPKNGRARVRVDLVGNDGDLADLSQKLFAGGIAILGFSEEEKDLEHMFMRVTRGLVT